jgi:hypothetical protein
MVLRVRGGRTVILVRSVLLIAVAAVLLAAGHVRAFAQGAIEGRVLDRVTGAPVVGARVVLVGHTLVWTTDQSGSFRSTDIPPGSYVLRVRRVGYHEGLWPIVVSDSAPVSQVFELEPLAVELPPEIVEGDREEESYWYGDFERRRAARRGQFLTREEMRHHGLATLADLLRTLNGLRLVCGRSGCSIRMTRWTGCQPLYFQDGVPVSAELAERVAVVDLYAVEVYQLSQVPTEFQRGNLKCGVVAFWTRRGLPPR